MKNLVYWILVLFFFIIVDILSIFLLYYLYKDYTYERECLNTKIEILETVNRKIEEKLIVQTRDFASLKKEYDNYRKEYDDYKLLQSQREEENERFLRSLKEEYDAYKTSQNKKDEENAKILESINCEIKIFQKQISELNSLITFGNEVFRETLQKNAEQLAEDMNNLKDSIKREIDSVEKEINISIDQRNLEMLKEFHQEIERVNLELKKLIAEIQRLDRENKLMHYNYDAVLKIQMNEEGNKTDSFSSQANECKSTSNVMGQKTGTKSDNEKREGRLSRFFKELFINE